MVCETRIIFVETIQEGKPDFTKMVKVMKKHQAKFRPLRWKPDQITVNGTVVGYLLYFQHDC